MKLKLPIASLVLSLFFIGLFNIDTSKSTQNLAKRHAYFLKHNPLNKRLKLGKKERQNLGLPPNRYFEREYLLEMNPALGRPTPEKLFALQNQLKNKSIMRRAPGDASDNTWVERGPNNVGGRTRALLFDPNDATHKRVFAGGVSGGLWVNSDITSASSSWTRISGISENISVTAFTVDPNNSQIIYVATGETYVNGDVTGNGIWKSTDGGTTWTQAFGGSTGATTINSSSQFIVPGQYNVNDIKAWDNGGSTVIFAGIGSNSFSYSGTDPTFIGAFEYGLYKSSDNGANWTSVSMNVPSTSHSYEVNDIEIAADNSIWVSTKNTVFGDGGGVVLQSTNGTLFTLKHTITNGKRTQIGVSGANAGTIYVLGQLSTGSPITILKTTDGFATTPTALALPNDADTGIPANDFTRTQSWYDLLLEVDPSNESIVYVGGVDAFRSADGGTSWAQLTKWSNNNNLAALTIPLVHADFHALTFHPTDRNIAVIGNDGGVYYASSLSGALSSTTAISSRNKDYNITQFYKGAIGQSTSTELLLAGAQDNGSLFVNGASAGVNTFTDIFGGDGSYEYIDKDGAYLIVSFTNNVYSLFPLPYTGAGEIVIQNDDTTGAFINPADLDDNLDILYTDGIDGTTNQIARYTALTTTPVRTNFTDGMLTGEPTAFKVSPYTTGSTTLLVGTDNGRLIKITTADTSPTWSNISALNFLGSISDIHFGANENEIIVTFHNYGVTSVWFTTDGGTTWASKEGDLPDLPIKAVMMNPSNNDEVIVGTDLGIWRTASFKTTSPTWVQSQNGMQNVKVTSFDLRTADNTVLASTYGRGLFTGIFKTGVLAVSNFEKSKNSILIYPTVSDGNFTIMPKVNLGKTRLNIFDLRGRQVFSKQTNFIQGSETPLRVNLKSGVYILKLEADNFNYSQKIVIK